MLSAEEYYGLNRNGLPAKNYIKFTFVATGVPRSVKNFGEGVYCCVPIPPPAPPHPTIVGPKTFYGKAAPAMFIKQFYRPINSLGLA